MLEKQMYNSQNSSPIELPSSKQLARSTIFALLTAAVLLVSVILPAEYAIDPTGIGRLLGLTQMGEIKQELAREVSDHGGFEMLPADTPVTQLSATDKGSEKLAIQTEETPPDVKPWREEIRISLEPGEGKELKLVMEKNAVARFLWDAQPGSVNFDMHGDGDGKESISYEKGFFVPSQEGELKAAFKGKHGWFWRNRNEVSVEVVLRLDGDYSDIKRYF